MTIQEIVAQVDAIVQQSKVELEVIKSVRSIGDLISKADTLYALASKIVMAVKQVADESKETLTNEDKLKAATEYLCSILQFKGFWVWLNAIKKPIFDLILSLAWQSLKPKTASVTAPAPVAKKRAYKKSAK